MATTYDKIATTTLGSAATSITFSSIAASWTALRLVFVGKASIGATYIGPWIQFNSDTSTNYSWTDVGGNGSAAYSASAANYSNVSFANNSSIGSTNNALLDINIFSYAGSTYKTILSQLSNDMNGSGSTESSVGLWRSTSAITSIVLNAGFTNGFPSGTTATLYGIKSA